MTMFWLVTMDVAILFECLLQVRYVDLRVKTIMIVNTALTPKTKPRM